MNAEQWRRVARPVVDDLWAALVEFGTLEFSPRDVPPALYGAFWEAAYGRDLAEFRRAARAIQREAARRLAAHGS